MDKNKCNSCGEAKCSCKNKDFTKAVIEIDNPEQITLMRRVVIPASMGDDTTVPPAVGKYKNVLLFYEANSKSYLYSSDGIPTLLANGLTDYEEAVNLPQINGVTLTGDKTSADLGLQSALTAGDGIEIENDTISISDIEQYAHFFDTVADMKVATNLVAGDYAKTLGFHTINDGGGALYKITDTGTANEMDVIAVGSLYANLIIPEIVTPEMFGAYGDGVHDDHDAIASAFSHCKVVNFIQAKTYLTGSTLTLTYQMILNGNNSLLIGNSEGVYPIITVNGSTSPAWRTKININDLRIECGSGIDDRHHEGILFDRATDFTIRNVYVRYATNGFHFKNSLIFQFENCHVQNTNCALYCDDVSSSPVNNVKFDKCTFVANKYVLNSTVFAFKNALFLNCEIEANASDNNDAVIVIPSSQSGTGGSSLIFDGCWFEANTPRDILSATDDYTPINVKNCYITHVQNTAYSFAKGTDEKFTITLDSCQDISTYISNGSTVESSSIYVSEINCRPRYSPNNPSGYVGVVNNFNTFNKASIWELTLFQNGSVKTGQIKAYSDYLNINANETNGVRLADNNYLHPFVIGNIYLWAYSSRLYYKIGSAPASYTDGTVLAE